MPSENKPYKRPPLSPSSSHPTKKAHSNFSRSIPSIPHMAHKNSIDANREGAEIYTGDDLCRQKSIDLLEELGLPSGLLPMDGNVEELGINRQTGFLWVRQKKALNYTFRKAGRLVCFGTEVTGFLENHKIKQVTGVKSRELLMWFPLGEFFVDPKNPTKITFRTPAGLSLSYPTSAFELEEKRTQTLTA